MIQGKKHRNTDRHSRVHAKLGHTKNLRITSYTPEPEVMHLSPKS